MILASLALAACAARGPDVAISPKFRATYQCDDAAMEAARARMSQRTSVAPEVGWDACQVLSDLGQPLTAELVKGAPPDITFRWSYDDPDNPCCRTVLLTLVADRYDAEIRTGWFTVHAIEHTSR